jgi:hypothetical protein
MSHRIKCVVELSSIPNEQLSDLIVAENLKNLEITWLTEQKAVISCEESKTKIHKMIDKLELKLLDEPTHILHGMIKGKEPKDIEVIRKW